jgi:hypothetical protein
MFNCLFRVMSAFLLLFVGIVFSGSKYQLDKFKKKEKKKKKTT